MIVLGVDAHKQVHAAVALNELGREIGKWRGDNTVTQWHALEMWAASLGQEERQWAVEGAWGYGRGLAQFLVAQGERVYEVNPRWTARERRHARSMSKNDRLDARAVARCVLREETLLPQIRPDDETSVLTELTHGRRNALKEATRLRNQIHQQLLQIDPEYRAHLPKLRTKAGLLALETYQAPDADPTVLAQTRAVLVRRLAARLHVALGQIKELEHEIHACAKAARFGSLRSIKGVNWLTAAEIAAVLGPGDRFATEAQLAAYGAAAPMEASSAGHAHHRLNRGGNRRLNCLTHQIVVTQLRTDERAKAYCARRQAEGKSKRDAMRALKRYIIRAIFHAWKDCQQLRASQQSEQAA
jgi:transposase